MLQGYGLRHSLVKSVHSCRRGDNKPFLSWCWYIADGACVPVAALNVLQTCDCQGCPGASDDPQLDQNVQCIQAGCDGVWSAGTSSRFHGGSQSFLTTPPRHLILMPFPHCPQWMQDLSIKGADGLPKSNMLHIRGQHLAGDVAWKHAQ